jgi:hypothetical protein
MKIVRVGLALLMLQVLTLAGAGARESYCDTALRRCVAECEQFPSYVRAGCKIGCGIGYLNCG